MRCNLFFLKKVLPVKISVNAFLDILNLFGFESFLNTEKYVVEIVVPSNRTDCFSLYGLLQNVFGISEKCCEKGFKRYVIKHEEKLFTTMFMIKDATQFKKLTVVMDYLLFLSVKTKGNDIFYNMFLFCLYFFGYYFQLHFLTNFFSVNLFFVKKLFSVTVKNGLLYVDNHMFNVNRVFLNNKHVYNIPNDGTTWFILLNYNISQEYFDYYRCFVCKTVVNDIMVYDYNLFFSNVLSGCNVIAFYNFFGEIFTKENVICFIDYENLFKHAKYFVYLRLSTVEKVFKFIDYVNFIETCIEEVLCKYVKCATGWLILTKEYRKDLQTEGSFIDICIRFYGYHNKNLALFNLNFNLCKQHATISQFFEDRLNSFFLSCGFQEVLNYSFISVKENSFFVNVACLKELSVKNPIIKDMCVMRTSLLPGILLNLKKWTYKNAGGEKRFKLYEYGTCFLQNFNECVLELPVICGVYLDNVISTALTVDYTVSTMSFYELKRDIACIFNIVGCFDSLDYYASDTVYTDRVGCFVLRFSGIYVGNVGKIKQEILNYFSIKKQVAFFNIYIERFRKTQRLEFFKKKCQPVVFRDLSFLLDNKITDREVYFFLKELNMLKLRKFVIYDVFQIEMEYTLICVCLRVSLMDESCTMDGEDIVICLSVVMNMLYRTCNVLFRFS